MTTSKTPSEQTSTAVDRYNEALERYRRFIAANPQFNDLEVLVEDLNDATAALEADVREGSAVHPDFTPGAPRKTIDEDALLAYLGEETALELGVLVPKTTLSVDKEKIKELLGQDFFSEEEKKNFIKVITPFKVPKKMVLR